MKNNAFGMDSESVGALLNFAAQTAKENKYAAGLYLRLSRDDNNGNSESMSIQSQKQMLLLYAKEHGYGVEEIYIDDGYSGTNFERPNFKRMISDIKLGKINMVITKDLSRLGRDYVHTGLYTEFFFPENNVRYIAINDGYDSKKDDNDIAPFKHILNEMYAKDISKKIKSSRKVAAREGKFMGSITPYGYRRSDTDKHKLVIDEPAASIVKRIFELFKNQESARHIAEQLNNESIPNPHTYYYQRMEQDNPYKKSSKTWSSATITSILKNQVYLGHTIQSKRAVKSFKSKKVAQLPPEMWVAVENTHEPLIDNETWSAVQLLFASRRRTKVRQKDTSINGDVSLFSNLIYCKDCGAKLVLSSTKRSTYKEYYYKCCRYVQHGTADCTPHRINIYTISSIVLEDIKANARLAQEDEEHFIKTLYNINLKERDTEIGAYKKREAQIKARQSEIDDLVQKSFEKNCAGILPDKMLANLIQKYEQEKSELEIEQYEIQERRLQSESQTKDISQEVSKLKQYAEVKELNRKIVTSLIRSIHLSEPVKVDGVRTFDVEIRYKFQNPFVKEEDRNKDGAAAV